MNFLKNGIVFDAGYSSVKTENDAVAPNGFREATKFLSQDGENILLHSEDFQNWSLIGSSPPTITQTNVDGPFGTKTAEKITFGTSTDSRVEQQNRSVTIAGDYVFSIWLRADSPQTIYIGFNSWEQICNVTTVWTRFFITRNRSVGGIYPQIRKAGTDTSSFVFYAYGAQVERGTAPTNYRKTTTVAVGAASTFITQHDPITFAENEIYCRSIFVKPVSSSPEPKLVPFLIGGTNPEARWCSFNLITKTFSWGLQAGSTSEIGTIFKANYKLYDNGWIRVWWNIKKTSTNVLSFDTYWLDGYGGGSGGSMWVWGAQVEKVTTLDSEPSDFEPVGVSPASILSSQNHLVDSVNLPVNNVTIKYENNAIAPNGVKEASKFENTPSKDSIITPKVSTSLTITNGKFYCRSIFLKSAGANSTIIPFLFSTSDNSLNRLINFDIKNKTIRSEHPSDQDCYVKYKEYDGGWIRFWVTVEKTAERTISQNWYIGGYGSSSSKHEFWAWGAQFEEVATLYSEPGDYEPVGVKSLSTFYNRDSNIQLSLTDKIGQSDSLGGYYTPVYGSRVTFESRLSSYETSDGYFNTIPLSVNNLKAKFDLRFDLNEFESQRLIDFIESKQGIRAFEIDDPTDIYRPLPGFCNEYSVNHINKNHYEVAVSFEVDQVPSLLNWKNSSFVNYEIGQWIENTDYKKYDIIYYDLNDINPTDQVIGVNLDGINKLNKFYYASRDFNSSIGTDTQPSDALSPWRQDFFFEPDIGLQNDVSMAIQKNEFKNSFVQRVKTKKNIGALKLNYKFSNITTQKARAILHFLENKGGYRRFRLDMKSIYNKPKVFYAPSWTHTWKSVNSHDIEVVLIEDPLGIISKKN